MRLLLYVLLSAVLAQQADSQPTFKSGVNLIEVDVVVTNRAGQPVRGLRREDFEVTEDGKPVTVSTFLAVDLPAARPGSPLPPPDRSGSSLASNDQPEDGRVILIVLDDYHVRFDAGLAVRSRVVARKLIEQLGPSDLAAVMATSGQTSMQVEFTGDKARLAAAIDRFFPQAEPISSGATADATMARALGKPIGGGIDFVREIKARWAYDALSNAAKALAQIPRRRKTILFVSEGLPVSVEELITDRSASAAMDSLREFVLTAQRSNVAIYPVDPCGLSTECSLSAQENLRSLAENTGGFAVVNTNAPEAAVERIVAENGTYYLLGYDSPAPPNDGKRHRIRVRTRVPDVDVRARTEYVSPPRAAKPRPAATPMEALVAAPIQTRGLTLRVATVPAPLASSPGASLVLGIEVPAKDAVAAGSIDFTVLAVDSGGRVQARQRFGNTFEGRGTVGGWARLRSHVPLKPGTYVIRVAAVGANKSQGSVFTEVDVPKFDGDLVMGGLSLAVPSPAAAVNAKQDPHGPALSPLATTRIPAGVPLSAAVPLRLSSRRANEPLTITATLTRPEGSTTDLDTGPRDAGGFARPSGQIYSVALPPNLGPGPHRLAIEALSGRIRATREIRFTIMPVE